MTSELHLIVLWANARYKETAILEDIAKHTTIRAAYDITWTRTRVADNFSRFYGKKLPNKSSKEKECGTGPFLLVIAEDTKVNYGFVKTSRGHEQANLTLFAMKERYRSWTGGGHKIHTTNSIAETTHDAALLLGLNYEDLGKSLPPTWNGSIKPLTRNVTGLDGWQSLKELFYTLNATIRYAVLRNHEILPHQFASDLHGDIDLLVEDYELAKLALNATSVFKEDYRVHCKTKINNEDVYWDLRYLGDDYYCQAFENRLLQNRTKNQHDIYTLNTEDYFYSLIYHALVHKTRIASDYYDKLATLFRTLKLDNHYNLSDYQDPFDLYLNLLENFMTQNGYTFTKHKDNSVFYSEKPYLSGIRTFLEKTYDFSDIQPVHSGFPTETGSILLSAQLKDNPVFIKAGRAEGRFKLTTGLFLNEFNRAEELFKINQINFAKPIFFRDHVDGYKFVATAFIRGTSLATCMSHSNLMPTDRAQWFEDILSISQALRQSNVVHRNITPENLIVSNTGHLVLTDFQMAVAKEPYRELPFLRKRRRMLRRLGGLYAPKPGFWDDQYSLLKILEEIGSSEISQMRYEEIHHELQSVIGQSQISYIARGVRNLTRSLRPDLLYYKLMAHLAFSKEKRVQYKVKHRESMNFKTH